MPYHLGFTCDEYVVQDDARGCDVYAPYDGVFFLLHAVLSIAHTCT